MGYLNSIQKLVETPYSLTVISTFSKMLVRAGSFLVIAPLLGPAGQASIAVNSALAAIVVLLFIFGLPVRALREIASHPESAQAHFRGDMKLMTALIIPTLTLGLVTQWLLGVHAEVNIFIIILMAAIFTAVGDYCSAVLRALNEFGCEAKISFSTSVIHFLLLATVALVTRSVIGVASAILISRALFAAVSLYRTYFGTVIKISSVCGELLTIRGTMVAARAYAFDAVFATAISNIDLLVLDKFSDRNTVGIYSAGSRFVALFLSLPPIFQNVIIPTLTKQIGTYKFRKSVLHVAYGFIGFSLISSLAIYIGGDFLVSNILGNQYRDVNRYWIVLIIFFFAKVYESYRGIMMYVHGLVSERAIRLMVCVAVMALFGSLAIYYFSLGIFVLALAFCIFMLGISYPVPQLMKS